MDFVWRVVTDPSDLTNDVVLAAVYNGVSRSDDGGATWTEVLGFQQGSVSAPYLIMLIWLLLQRVFFMQLFPVTDQIKVFIVQMME